MPQKADDLNAVRTIVKALESFDPKEQERIIRWAREKLGLWVSSSTQDRTPSSASNVAPLIESGPLTRPQVDIKAFVSLKQPASENQLAVVIAYYYKFEAPQSERKEFITKEIVQDACRLAVVTRPKKIAQTLVNAHHQGLLDKGSEKGSYVINSVGENLVAIALPSTGKQAKK
jgi:hypothetical protein